MNLLLKTVFLFGLFCYVSGIRRCVYSCSCEECGNNGLIQECPNDDDYCYTAHHDSVSGSGVIYCYYCRYYCQHPLEIRLCPDIDGLNCFASEAITPNGTLEMEKGCVDPNDPFWIERCKNLNDMIDGSCYMCDDNLCNFK